MKDYLECGKILNAHGMNGAVRVEQHCDSPEIFASLKNVYFETDGGLKNLKIVRTSLYKNVVLTFFDGVDTLDAAIGLKNKILYAARKDLPCPDGEFFIADLIGLKVIDADTGRVCGVLKDMITSSAQDILEVETENGIRLIPSVSEFVREINLDKGIFITPIEGLL